MLTMGICTAKNDFSYCVLEGDKNHFNVIYEDVDTIQIQESQQLMNWYYSNFQNLLEKYEPSQIGIKLSLDATREQVAYWYYPIGLLQYICLQKNIATKEFTTRNFVPSKFNLPKEKDIYEHIHNAFPPTNSKKRGKNQCYAFLSAWILLP